MLYERLLRPFLFQMDAERAHEFVISSLAAAQRSGMGPSLLSLAAGSRPAGLETRVFGLRFPSPVGLAAGFDKDCRLLPSLSALGFGFLELGSVTLRPQPGNPKPRIFRLPEFEAIINRLGFNSRGAAYAAERLRHFGRMPMPIGINLGLNADCPAEQAPMQYAETFRLLEPYGDYFVVNVSSPNTTGLRDLQERLRLERILEAIQSLNPAAKPLLVKIAPDLSEQQLGEIIETIAKCASGVVAANTSLSREGLPADAGEIRGGLSGAPVRSRSTRIIASIYRSTQGKLPIIGVGGVFSGADAFEKIRAGASLVQIYTSLIYRGPAAAVRIQRELAGLLSHYGYASVAEAVGTGS